MDIKIKSVDNINNIPFDAAHVVDQRDEQAPAPAEAVPPVKQVSLFALAAQKEMQPLSLSFSRRSMLYDWINKGNDPKTVTDLVIQDGWSSREISTIPGQEFRDQDLAFIAERFTNLRSIKFNCTYYNITDSSMKELKKLPHLTSVWLRETHKITDAGIYELALACPQLNTLILEALPGVRGATLEKTLANLPHLQSLHLLRSYPHANFPISWQMLAKALAGSTISHLELSNNFDTGNGPAAIALWHQSFSMMPNLRSISMNRQEAYQARTILAAAPNLQTLNLWGTPLEADHELPPSLKTLDISGYVFNRAAFPGVVQKASRLPQLETLSITSNYFPANYSEIDFAKLLTTDFPALKELRFNDSLRFNDHIDEGLIGLAKKLQSLRNGLKVTLKPV